MSPDLYIPTNKFKFEGEMNTMAKLATIRNMSLEESQRLQTVPGVFPDVFLRELDVINEELKIVDEVPKVFLNLHVGSNQTFQVSLEQCEIREDPSRVQYQLIPQAPMGMVEQAAQTTLQPSMPVQPPSISLAELQQQKEQEKIEKVQRQLEIQAAARAAEEAQKQAILDSARSQLGIGSQVGASAPSIASPASVSVSVPSATPVTGAFQYQTQEDGSISIEGLTPITGAMAFMMLSSGYEVIDGEGGALEFHKRSGQIRRYLGQEENALDVIAVQALITPSYFVHESFLKAFIQSFAKIGQASF